MANQHVVEVLTEALADLEQRIDGLNFQVDRLQSDFNHARKELAAALEKREALEATVRRFEG